mgnify:FL=1
MQILKKQAKQKTVQVEVVGENSPVEITEKYLAEIISARVKHILDRVKQDLTRGRLLDLPGGIVLVGGTAIMPGVVEVAQEIFETNVKLYVPNQVGIRNPMFANVISLVEYVGLLTEVDIIAQQAVSGEEYLRRKPIDNEAPALSLIELLLQHLEWLLSQILFQLRTPLRYLCQLKKKS